MVAFEQLYRAHAGALLAQVIRPRAASAADAEDLLVDTFRAALEGLGRFTWRERGLFPWLARIASNKAIDLARARAARARATERLGAEPVAPAPTPEVLLVGHADRAATREAVHVVLGDINPRYARALRLRLLEGQPRAACAEALEVKLGTFDVLLLRAVRSFRAAWLARFGPPEGDPGGGDDGA